MNSMNMILGIITISDTCAIIMAVIAIIGFCVLIFKSGNKFGEIKTSIDNIKSSIENDIKPHVKTIPVINERVTTLWADRVSVRRSPISLNEKGKKILEESKIGEIINQHYNEIIKIVKEKKPENAYQVQLVLPDVIKELKNMDICKNKLEQSAFNTGVDIDTILYVGAIDVRDRVIQELNFNIEDIDKFIPEI